MFKHSIVNSIQFADIAFYWNWKAFNPTPLPDGLNNAKCRVVNKKLLDTSKTFVDNRFYDVFGYRSMLEKPEIGQRVVTKTERNGIHNGRIIEFNGAFHKDWLFQKYIDTLKDGYYNDLRVMIINGKLSNIMFIKKLDNFACIEMISCSVVNTKDIFSIDEISKINEFCKDYIDYAELDILRDNEDGRIYIIDVNNTPGGGLMSHVTQDKTKIILNEINKIFTY